MTRIVKKAAERRKDIVCAAREHFKTQDFRKLTMQDLMNKLNIAKGTIYHHFSSKEEILEAVVEDMVEEELNRKVDLLNKHQKLNALDKFKLLLFDSQIADDNETLLENLHHPDNARIHARQLALFITKISPLFAAVISQGCDEGIFENEHPLESSEFLIAGIQFLTDAGFHPWGREHIDRRMNGLPFLLETLLGASKGTFDFLKEN